MNQLSLSFTDQVAPFFPEVSYIETSCNLIDYLASKSYMHTDEVNQLKEYIEDLDLCAEQALALEFIHYYKGGN